jgi:hypothetical protein
VVPQHYVATTSSAAPTAIQLPTAAPSKERPLSRQNLADLIVIVILSSATLACCVLFSCCRSNEVLWRTYGKDNRVPHTAKLSQGFKVVSPSRTCQGAGISTGGTKISVTGSETRNGETEIEQGEATIMSKKKSCGVVVVCSLLVAFALAQGAAAQT